MHDLNGWIASLFEHPDLLRMGHAQRGVDLNLGLGWLYYAMGRILRPSVAVVIGSYRGFAPLVLARALADNSEGGCVCFIDPSFVDDFWKDEEKVRAYFGSLGGANVTHHAATTQEFVASEAYRELDQIGLVFVDGYHSAEQARFDFHAFAGKLAPQGVIMLHDSVWRGSSPIYGPGREYVHNVVDFVDELKGSPDWQTFDVPFGNGVTMVRRQIAPPAPSPPSRSAYDRETFEPR